MRSSTCSRQSFTLAKDLLENGAAALQSNHRPERQLQEKQKRIEFLQKKVQTKDAGCGRRQPGQCLAGAQTRRTAIAVEG